MKIHRSPFLLLVSLVFLALVDAMSAAPEKNDSPFPKSDRAVAYSFNLEGEALRSIVVDGQLNKTVTKKNSVVLNAKQLQELAGHVTGKHPEVPSADCYFPRHAVVFFKGEKPIGYVEVCFECGGKRTDLKDLAPVWNLKGLRTFFENLKLPLR